MKNMLEMMLEDFADQQEENRKAWEAFWRELATDEVTDRDVEWVVRKNRDKLLDNAA